MPCLPLCPLCWWELVEKLAYGLFSRLLARDTSTQVVVDETMPLKDTSSARMIGGSQVQYQPQTAPKLQLQRK
eukprot:388024-Amphidinium_carterae.1